MSVWELTTIIYLHIILLLYVTSCIWTNVCLSDMNWKKCIHLTFAWTSYCFFFTNNNNNTWHVVCRSLPIRYHGYLSWVCHSSSFSFIHLHVTSSWLTAELYNGWGSLFFLHESTIEKKKYNDANKYVLVCGLLAFVPATVPLKGLFYGCVL